MTLWQLEWHRLARTRRLLLLIGVYVFFGLLGPLTARYLSQIVDRLGGGVSVDLPEPTPAAGVAQFTGNAQQIGLLAVVFVAAAAMAVDANAEMSIFLRTRIGSMRSIITPRYVVNTLAAVAAFTLGSLAAWYETTILLGSLPLGSFVIGVLLGVVYLAFAVALTAFVASLLRGVAASALTSILILIVLGTVTLIPQAAPWTPSHLVGALDGLLAGDAGSPYLRSLIVTVLLTPALLLLAVRRFAAREL